MTLIHIIQPFGIDVISFYKNWQLWQWSHQKFNNKTIYQKQKKKTKIQEILKTRNEKFCFKTEINFSTHVLGYYFLCINWPLESSQKNEKEQKLYEDVNYIMIHERGFAHNHIPKATISLKYQAKKKCAPYVIMLTTEMFYFFFFLFMLPLEWMNFTVMILDCFFWVCEFHSKNLIVF